MSDKKNDKILLIEGDQSVGARVEHLLTRARYEVRWVNSSYAAIAALEASAASPFSLVISAYRVPGMSGDDLLEHARFASPDTQRMLFADSSLFSEASEMGSLINAINRAKIHSCILIPFEDEQLMTEVSRRCEQFRKIQKRGSLKKLTEHQNMKMYQIAVNLKKKKALFEQQIKERRKIIQRLLSDQPSELKVDELKTDEFKVAIEKLFSSESVMSNFKKVASNLKLFLEDIAFDGKLQLRQFDDLTLSMLINQESGVAALERTGAADQEREKKRAEQESAPIESDRELIENIMNLFVQHEMRKTCAKGFPRYFREEFPEICKKECSTPCEKEFLQPYQTQMAEEPYESGQISESEQIAESALRAAIEPVNSQIRYFFKVNHLNSDKVHPDGTHPGGTVDLNNRRERSSVLKGALLAEKLPFKRGVPGIDSSGNPVPVAEPEDLLFTTGVNTRFSEDNLKIFATADGQPHLDVMGTVSVFPEMSIQGDVDHETGNLSFGGNIVVNGSLKRGVKVKCANLTVEAVEGAEIHLTGDLDVSSGIINSDVINVQGDVQARYINNSRVKALGDVIVQREIIDSELFTGGRCINSAGLITSSFINARRGVVAGRIGTEKAAPSKLEVGTEGIIAMMIADLDERIEKNRDKIRELQDEILSFESEEKILHGRISGAAYIHDRANIELRGIEKQLPQVEASEDIMEVQRLFKTVKALKSKADASEKILFEAFERQDLIVGMVMAKQREIETLENKILSIRLKQRGIEEFSRRSKPEAEVRVSGQIMSGTLVTGVRSKLLLKTDRSGCRIDEVAKGVDMVQNSSSYGALYEMVVSSYRRSA